MLVPYPLVAGDSTPTRGEVLQPRAEMWIDAADSALGAAESPQRMDIRVEARVDYDAASRIYHYAYTVFNEVSSDSCLETFALRPVPEPIGMEGPKNWWADCCSWEGVEPVAVWSVKGEDNEPYPAVGSAQLVRSVANPRPGEAVGGFSLKSSAPPVNIRFYAAQFDTLPEGEGDELAAATIFDHGVQGEIVGPDTSRSASFRPVRAQLTYRSKSTNPPGEARIHYTVDRTQDIRLEICDQDGRTIRVIRRGHVSAGPAGAIWNGLDRRGMAVPAGSYSWRLSSRAKVFDSRPIRVP